MAHTENKLGEVMEVSASNFLQRLGFEINSHSLQQKIPRAALARAMEHQRARTLTVQWICAVVFALVSLLVIYHRAPPMFNVVSLGIMIVAGFSIPIATHLASPSRLYVWTIVWIVYVFLVVVGQTAFYLFGSEHTLLIKEGFLPYATIAITPLQLMMNAFLVPRASRRAQIALLTIMAGLIGIFAITHATEFENLYGFSKLVLTVVVIGPITFILLATTLDAHTMVSNEALRAAEVLPARQLAEELMRVEKFVSAFRDSNYNMPHAQVYVESSSATGISGDTAYIKSTEGGNLRFGLCDAMGHGAFAGMLAIVAKSVLDTFAADSHPAQWAKSIHRVLVGCGTDGFMTGVFGDLCPNGEVRLVYAAHPAGFLLRQDGSVTQTEHGPSSAMGMFDNTLDLATASEQLQPGDALLLVTDGLFEISDISGKQLGVDGLQRLIAELLEAQTPYSHLTSELMKNALIHGSTSRFDDDASAILIHFTHT